MSSCNSLHFLRLTLVFFLQVLCFSFQWPSNFYCFLLISNKIFRARSKVFSISIKINIIYCNKKVGLRKSLHFVQLGTEFSVQDLCLLFQGNSDFYCSLRALKKNYRSKRYYILNNSYVLLRSISYSPW
jgi:hypothetical protein